MYELFSSPSKYISSDSVSLFKESDVKNEFLQNLFKKGHSMVESTFVQVHVSHVAALEVVSDEQIVVAVVLVNAVMTVIGLATVAVTQDLVSQKGRLHHLSNSGFRIS